MTLAQVCTGAQVFARGPNAASDPCSKLMCLTWAESRAFRRRRGSWWASATELTASVQTSHLSRRMAGQMIRIVIHQLQEALDAR